MKTSGMNRLRRGLLPAAAVMLVAACGSPTAPASAGASNASQSGAPTAVSSGATSEVKIGILMPLSGPAADFGSKLKNHAQFAADEINAAGGVKSLGGAQIKLVFADTQSRPEIGQSETERLILQEKVDGLIGCYNSSVTLPCTEVAEQHGVPVVVFSSVNSKITERGFKYTFRPNETSSGTVDTLMAFIDSQEAATQKKITSYAVLFANNDFGKGTSDDFLAAAPKAWNLVGTESFDPGVADLTPTVLKLKNANPDLVLTIGDQPDSNLIYQTFNEQNFRPKVGVDFAGSAQNEFQVLLGANEGLFTLSQWAPAVADSRPWLKAHIDAYTAKFGEAPQPEGLQAYSNVYIWLDVLERAGTVDKAKLRDALAATNLTDESQSPALIMPYKTIRFGTDGQNPDASLLVLQAAGGKRVIAYPDTLKTPGYNVQWFMGG